MSWKQDPTASIGAVETATVYLGEMVAARHRIPAGFDSAPHYRSFPGGACPCDHWCYLVRGSLRYRLPDGVTILARAGEAFHVPPGHLCDVLEDSELIEFTRTGEYRDKLAGLSASEPQTRRFRQSGRPEDAA